MITKQPRLSRSCVCLLTKQEPTSGSLGVVGEVATLKGSPATPVVRRRVIRSPLPGDKVMTPVKRRSQTVQPPQQRMFPNRAINRFGKRRIWRLPHSSSAGILTKFFLPEGKRALLPCSLDVLFQSSGTFLHPLSWFLISDK